MKSFQNSSSSSLTGKYITPIQTANNTSWWFDLAFFSIGPI